MYPTNAGSERDEKLYVESETLSVKRIEALCGAWETAPAMHPQVQKEYWTNIRMRWNTHSNAVEGNTLTYRETVLFLIFGKTEGRHRFREYVEIEGHDVAIEYMNGLLADGRVLSEADIRTLHKLLLVKDYTLPMRTADGQRGHRTVRVGQYKTALNAVIRPDGSVYRFVSPEETPMHMQSFMQRLRQGIEECRHNPEADIACVMAETHHEFIRIHPFDDGNGRMGRLLLNYAAQSCGYPPIVIAVDQRDEYIECLDRAEVLGVRPLRDFLAARLVETLAFGLAVKRGVCEPTWKNEKADPSMKPINGLPSLGDTVVIADACTPAYK